MQLSFKEREFIGGSYGVFGMEHRTLADIGEQFLMDENGAIKARDKALKKLATLCMDGKEYIGSHPLEYQERATKQSLYCIALANDFWEYAAEKYYQKQKETQRAVFDIIYLRDLYRTISAALGSE